MDLLRPSEDQYVQFPLDEPARLLVSIDTEEEFDWNQPVVRKLHTVESARYLWRTDAIFERFGVCPSYFIDYPVATDPGISTNLAELCAKGRCNVGAHLHPWTNPPHEEELSTYASFPGNLKPELEERKLRTLTEIIAERVKQRPVTYRAGRYGVGPSTARILEKLGYKIDMSVVPLRDYSHLGGPDFSDLTAHPYWFGATENLLEIPITGGVLGSLSSFGPLRAAVLKSPLLARAHFPGVLARSGLLNRVYITPEGIPVADAKTLTRVLLEKGHRIFTLQFHSPSLEPGNTPYVRSRAELDKLLSWIEIYLDFFMTELGGVSATPMQIYERAQALRNGVPVGTSIGKLSAPVDERSSASFPTVPNPAERISSNCLIVASNFPPVRGGSAVLYGNLCKFANGRIAVLTAWRSYSSGEEIAGWRQHDQATGFPIDRLELLRPPLARPNRLVPKAVSFLLVDLPLMLRVLRRLMLIVREHGIEVVCIGELVYGGWLVFACRYLLKCKVVQYVLGEEITISGRSRSESMKRVYLRLSDSIIAISAFTRDALIAHMGVDPAKIELIPPGVDLTCFHEKPPDAKLRTRHGLTGKRIILSVARLVERKGIDKLLLALPSILQRHPDVHLVVVGKGPYYIELEAIARKTGMTGNVTFAGLVSDAELVDYYSMCDIFALPNRNMPNGDTEGFGLVFLEANACGRPVISGRAGGVVDAVHDGINGLTVDGNDPSAIANAILRLLGDPSLYATLREGGLVAARRSSWQRRTEQFNLLCTRLANGRSRSTARKAAGAKT